MNALVNYVNSFLFAFIPETKGFCVKRFLLRLAGAKIGDNVRICSSVRVIGTGRLEIGDHTWVGHQVLFCCSSQVKIGNHVDIAPRVYIGDGTHRIDMKGKRSAGEGYCMPVIVEDGAWICANATLLAGTFIKNKCVIAAGAVVNSSLSVAGIYGGVPAKIIKELDKV